KCGAEILRSFLRFLTFLLFPGFSFSTSRVSEALLLTVLAFTLALSLVTTTSAGTAAWHSWHSRHAAPSGHFLHHLLGFAESFKQRVDFRNVHTRAGGNTCTA